MSRAIAFVPTHRLGALLRADGGISIKRAIARAEQRLEAVRDACVAALDEKIDALAEVSALVPLRHSHIYSLATEIFGLASTFGLEELAQASSSLCDLLVGSREDAQHAADAKFVASVRVHIDAMRTLRRPELHADEPARRAVVEGLRRVASRTTPGV